MTYYYYNIIKVLELTRVRHLTLYLLYLLTNK